MIQRVLLAKLLKSLDLYPVVALLGSRQVGKTTLAKSIVSTLPKPVIYLDLERESDRSKLSEPELYLNQHKDSLVVFDEVQRVPEIFPLLRSLVDERIQAGDKSSHFLVLGSASRDLLQQSSETLAGRISYLELTPFLLKEISTLSSLNMNEYWLRGGYPNSLLANNERESIEWRQNFVSTFLERDLPQLGIQLSPQNLRRLWMMLAHQNGQTINYSKLATALGVGDNTVRRYIDVLTDSYMIRQLNPWTGNIKKRLIKAPKLYIRDTGLLHCLLSIETHEQLLGHPVCGFSWEGMILEQIVQSAPPSGPISFFRSGTHNEIDLVIEGSGQEVIAIEIKRTKTPALTKGFQQAFQDVKATRGYFIAPVDEAYPLAKDIWVIPPDDLGTLTGESA